MGVVHSLKWEKRNCERTGEIEVAGVILLVDKVSSAFPGLAV